jgi:N utilization substance protein A
VDFAKFGRRAILNLRQTLASKILELEHDSLYNKYKDKVGMIVSGEINMAYKREWLVIDDENNELILPRSEMIPADYEKKGEKTAGKHTYGNGDTIRAVIIRVDNENNNPKIILSRTSPDFLRRLLENEVPEISDGLITIHNIVRIPGERAKVAVESYDDRIDPIGACIGVKGSRIMGIVRELRNENIDVIQWSANPQLMIQRALNPARISRIDLGSSPEEKIKVYMQADEVKKGIGKGGVNIKLAGMLVGREIEVWREIQQNEEEEDDVLLSEFTDVIDPWVIERLQAIGCDTARSVMALDPAEIATRADLEDETVEEVLKILHAEFEE